MKKIISILLILIICFSTLSACTPKDVADIIGGILDSTPGEYTYTDFTQAEKDIFMTYLGEVIPFAPTDKYSVIEYVEGGGFESGIRYYTVGNKSEDFDSYKKFFSSFDLIDMKPDVEGNIWYYYKKTNVSINMAYYTSGYTSFIDVIAYYNFDEPTSEGELTNKGSKLPEGNDGVYNLDFTKAEYVQNVSDQNRYEDGCPTTGSVPVLVIPVEFSDSPASSKGCSIEKIKKILNGKGEDTDYYSVDEYYYISSYGKLDLDITVLDQWFMPEKSSTYYKKQTTSYAGESIGIGDQMILNEALDYLDDKMDLSKFDSDGNGTIDAVIMVNTLKVDSDESFHWAYRYWNIYSDENNNFYEYDGVYAQDYLWISYSFIHEKVNSRGTPSYSDTRVMNPQTFIHEFGHILGADDYYDTTYRNEKGPMQGLDIMDSTLGDHNPYTKFNFGWITTSRLVTTEKSVTLTLKPFSESGDTIIIANNWDDTLGAYQEYYILIYYTNTGLNSGGGGYFNTEGIVLYHVNASLCYEEYLYTVFYDVNNNNSTPGNEYGTANNLIEIVEYSSDKYILGEDASLGTTFDDNEELLHYTFKIVSLTEGEATISFSKK